MFRLLATAWSGLHLSQIIDSIAKRALECFIASSVLLMFKSLFARHESHQAAFGMNVLTVALQAAIRVVRIDRPLTVTLYL